LIGATDEFPRFRDSVGARTDIPGNVMIVPTKPTGGYSINLKGGLKRNRMIAGTTDCTDIINQIHNEYFL
jgi:hypothetical protein